MDARDVTQLLLHIKEVKEVIFAEPQIYQLEKDPAFNLVLKGEEKEARKPLKKVTQGFLANKRGDNYTELGTVLLQNYHQKSMILGFFPQDKLSVAKNHKCSTELFL